MSMSMDMSGTSSPPSRDLGDGDVEAVASFWSKILTSPADELGPHVDVHAVGDDHLDLTAETVDE